MHPLDQFRTFKLLRDGGMSEEDIAARHFVSPAIVKQRLRLASVSPKLHDVYADDGMTLEQLMAFSVTADQARQEQVWDNVSSSGYDEPYQIRRTLTENTVRASDRRAQFIGLDAYERAGGTVMRDLFEHDDGGWLQDVPLLDGLVTDKLKGEAEAIAAEGWKWIAVAVDFPYGHTNGLRKLEGEPADLTEEQGAALDALNAEYAKIEADYQDADELPDEIDQRLGEIEMARSAFEARSLVYDLAEIARAGAFVSIDAEGLLSIDRGYVRPGGRGARRRRSRQRRAGRRTDKRWTNQWLSPARGHHRRRHAGRTARGRGGRHDQAAARSADHRADRASHAGIAQCTGKRSRSGLPGGIAQFRTGDVL